MVLTNDRATILVEWRRRVRAGWGLGPHWHTIDGTAPLVGTLLDGSADPCNVLRELCGPFLDRLDRLAGIERRPQNHRAAAVADAHARARRDAQLGSRIRMHAQQRTALLGDRGRRLGER